MVYLCKPILRGLLLFVICWKATSGKINRFYYTLYVKYIILYKTNILPFLTICILILLSEGKYEVRWNSWCTPYEPDSYGTFHEAKQACDSLPTCAMFFGRRREGKQFLVEKVFGRFLLCSDTKATIKTSKAGSRLYIKHKIGKYLIIRYRLPK